MNKALLSAASGAVSCLAFAQAAIAGGMSYGPSPVVEDSGTDAGIYLLLAIGALLVIKSVVNPAPRQAAADETETKQ